MCRPHSAASASLAGTAGPSMTHTYRLLLRYTVSTKQVNKSLPVERPVRHVRLRATLDAKYLQPPDLVQVERRAPVQRERTRPHAAEEEFQPAGLYLGDR